MNIEIGKQYVYKENKNLIPHPNEKIEDGTLVTIESVVPGGVTLVGYQYPHKMDRLEETLKEKDISDDLKVILKQIKNAGYTKEEVLTYIENNF